MKNASLHVAVAMAFFALCSTAALGKPGLKKTFEISYAEIIPIQFDDDTITNVTRVESGGGRLKVSSFKDIEHLEVGLTNPDLQTSFGYGINWLNPRPDNFRNGIGTGFAVYIDNPDRLIDNGDGELSNAYKPGDGWFFQSTLSNPEGTDLISSGGFGVRLSLEGWVITATGNTDVGFDYGLQNGDHPQSAQTEFMGGEAVYSASEGWYVFETIWFANRNGGIDLVCSIYDADGSLVYQAEIRNAVSDIASAGSMGSAWIAQDGPRKPHGHCGSCNPVLPSYIGDLAIDNVRVIFDAHREPSFFFEIPHQHLIEISPS